MVTFLATSASSDERVQWPKQARAPPDDVLRHGTRRRALTSNVSHGFTMVRYARREQRAQHSAARSTCTDCWQRVGVAGATELVDGQPLVAGLRIPNPDVCTESFGSAR